MIKSNILSELNLEELKGTKFEDFIKIKKFIEGNILFDILYNGLGACYVLEGYIELISHTVDGKEFYRYFFPGDIVGVGECFIDKNQDSFEKDESLDIHIKENTLLAFLPFSKVFDLELENKNVILRKLITLSVKEKSSESSHYLGRALYSDEEFIIKAFEKIKTIKSSDTKEIAKGLNMNLRNLQRLLKKLEKMDLIVRKKDFVTIKDLEKFNDYKRKLIF